jgi:hypothetical protein
MQMLNSLLCSPSTAQKYYNQMDPYFLHNSLEGIQFFERQKVSIFLEGLDSSYSPAIS